MLENVKVIDWGREKDFWTGERVGLSARLLSLVIDFIELIFFMLRVPESFYVRD